MADKKKIFGVGASGLVGSRITELLNNYVIDNLSTETGIDITNPVTLDGIKNDNDHDLVLHLAAKADVDGCEKDKALGKDGAAWVINVQGVQNVVDACKPTNKKIIYISTDFVFDGANTPADGYDEEATPNPVNWYSVTKYEGEKVVMNSGLPYLILRIAYPYRKEFEPKKDFVRIIIDRLRSGQEVYGVTDHVMTPTFIDDIAFSIENLLDSDATGIYHVVGSEFITPYEAIMAIAAEFDLDPRQIKKTTREEFFKDRAMRPFNLSLKNAKIEHLGVRLQGFTDGLKRLKE